MTRGTAGAREHFLGRTPPVSSGGARWSPLVTGVPFATAGVPTEALRDAEPIGTILATFLVSGGGLGGVTGGRGVRARARAARPRTSPPATPVLGIDGFTFGDVRYIDPLLILAVAGLWWRW